MGKPLSTDQLASHSHNVTGSSYSPSSGQSGLHNFRTGTVATSNTGSGNAHSHNMSANFVGDATSVVQPYLTIIYIIKT